MKPKRLAGNYWIIPGLIRKSMPVIMNQTDPEESYSRIIDLITEHFKISAETLQGRSRLATHVHARHIAIYLCYKYVVRRVAAVGVFFNRDHTTVMYALKRLKDLMQTEDAIRREVDMLELKFL